MVGFLKGGGWPSQVFSYWLYERMPGPNLTASMFVYGVAESGPAKFGCPQGGRGALPAVLDYF